MAGLDRVVIAQRFVIPANAGNQYSRAFGGGVAHHQRSRLLGRPVDPDDDSGASVIAATQIPSRESEFQGTSLSIRREGDGTPKGAPLVTAAAYFPDCRKTEAHGNAFQRPAAAFFKTSVRSSGDSAHDDFAPLPVPVQPHQWQGPVVSPDGNPRPPDDAGHDPHARRRRSRPRYKRPGNAPLTGTG
jgi:hypothetical protein